MVTIQLSEKIGSCLDLSKGHRVGISYARVSADGASQVSEQANGYGAEKFQEAVQESIRFDQLGRRGCCDRCWQRQLFN